MAKTRFSQLLEERILKVLQERAADLAIGIPVEQYREQVGYCRGLRDSVAFIEEIEREFD